MTYENLLYEKKGAVGFITFNRPKVLNAINAAMMRELDDVVSSAVRDAGVRALVLTGAGEKAFVAGADINELARCSAIDGRELALFGQRVFARLENLGKPSIAAVNGFALGGGCELALACTIRLASRTARFGQPEVTLGLTPGYGG